MDSSKFLFPNIYVNSLMRTHSKRNINLQFSPLTDLIFFRMICEGCNKQIIDQLDFYFNNYLCGDGLYTNMMKSYFGLSQQCYQTESKIFYRENYEILSEIMQTLRDKFNCVVEKHHQNKEDIIEWMQKFMKSHIWENLPIVDSPAIVTLSSFNFEWSSSFKIEQITDNFNSLRDSIPTTMLNFNGTFNYVEDHDYLSSTILEIPFSNNCTSMLIVLPNKDVDVDSFANFLHNFNIENAWKKSKPELVNVWLPKLKVDNVIDIKKSYEEYFPNASSFCDFSKLTKHPSYASKMFSKSFLEIGEETVSFSVVSACDMVLKSVLKEMHINSMVKNRFANTAVRQKFQNLNIKAQETIFTTVIPENAYITEFIMIVDGKSYKSHVSEKKEAKEEYDKAFTSGKSAAHVELSTRDSNLFTISVNVAGNSEAEFILNYEEFLQRRYNQYELVLNINPGQLLDVLDVTVNIEESSTLKYVKIPSLRSGKEISKETQDNVSFTQNDISDYKAVIKFSPDIEMQKQIAHRMSEYLTDTTKEIEGISGQLVVQYDVDVDPKEGTILLNDGYFVHFYVPDDLPPLRKHVVFTLDVSSSMCGRPIECAKDAMLCILDQIEPNDLVSIVEFNHDVLVRNINEETAVHITTEFIIEDENIQTPNEPFLKYEQLKLPVPVAFNEITREKAKKAVRCMESSGSTNMSEALLVSLYLVKLGQDKYQNHQPIIVFLTDGYPTMGIINLEEIISMITKLNSENNKAPIFTLSFGDGADKSFLRRLSFKNFAFSRHIYEAADASLQLQQFYKLISSPLLTNVSFTYEDEIESTTRVNFPIYFRGSDLVVCGTYKNKSPKSVNCQINNGESKMILKPKIQKSVTPLERLWAFLTLNQLLNDMESVTDNTAVTKKALELALKYGFVTEITSLVVVKPDDEMGDVKDLNIREDENDDCSLSSSCLKSKRIKKTMIKRKCKRWVGGKEDIISVADNDEYNNEKETKDDVAPEMKIFKADRPFFILIQHKVDDKIIFLLVSKIENVSN